MTNRITITLAALLTASLPGCLAPTASPGEQPGVAAVAAVTPDCAARPDLLAWCADNGFREGWACGSDIDAMPAHPVEADLFCK